MILTIIVIIMALVWLLKETDFLRVNLMEQSKPEPFTHGKHNPKLDEPNIKTQIKTLPFPKTIIILATSSKDLELAAIKKQVARSLAHPKFLSASEDDEPMYKINRRNRQQRRLVRKHNTSY